jgi:hypothetical protein
MLCCHNCHVAPTVMHVVEAAMTLCVEGTSIALPVKIKDNSILLDYLKKVCMRTRLASYLVGTFAPTSHVLVHRLLV